MKNQEQLLRNKIEAYISEQESKYLILNALKNITDNHNEVTKVRIIKKLNSLYSGYHCFNNKEHGSRVMLKEQADRLINLSNYTLTKDEIDFLNLGVNCHLQPKYDHLTKKTEIEMLYHNIIDLEEKNDLIVNSNISNLLLAESCKNRYVRT